MPIKAIAPLKVGIVGTGYAAKKRAEALISDPRTELLVVTGNTPERLQEFCQTYQVKAIDSWTRLVDLSELDLIFVCTINRDSGAIARAAILAGKHVVVEYPLALEAKEAAEIIELAEANQKLLHVEHMEILGGLHQAIKQYLPQIGEVFYARYATISSQKSVQRSWKYHREMFGFP
ncbi:MAG: Gfo/Idh/MocA family protein, partial [Waterburya sp.]